MLLRVFFLFESFSRRKKGVNKIWSKETLKKLDGLKKIP